MKNIELFNSLVKNAFDYLTKSIKDFDSEHKYSLINFYTSIELILKARLLYDHWTLVIGGKMIFNYDDFIKGDFQSITSDEAIKRLRNAIKINVSKEFEKTINSLRKDRNKVIHFFHEAHSDESQDDLKIAIAKEQLNCWYHLNMFLTKECEDVFKPWKEEIEALNVELKKQRDYLKIVFINNEDRINNLMKKGVEIKKCPSCNFNAMPIDKYYNEFSKNKCIVCDFVEITISIECPGCNNIIQFINDGFSRCNNCMTTFEPEDLAEILYPISISPDEMFETNRGNCSNCDSHQTVIQINHDNYFCTSCFTSFDKLYLCDWCNEFNTKEYNASSILGCNFCDGSENYD